jgi:hypothetical protein
MLLENMLSWLSCLSDTDKHVSLLLSHAVAKMLHVSGTPDHPAQMC